MVNIALLIIVDSKKCLVLLCRSQDKGVDGCGHTMSLTISGQKSQIFPIIHGDMDIAIVFSYQLGMVDNCRLLSHLCYDHGRVVELQSLVVVAGMCHWM